jgi:hypothetical protein
MVKIIHKIRLLLWRKTLNNTLPVALHNRRKLFLFFLLKNRIKFGNNTTFISWIQSMTTQINNKKLDKTKKYLLPEQVIHNVGCRFLHFPYKDKVL